MNYKLTSEEHLHTDFTTLHCSATVANDISSIYIDEIDVKDSDSTLVRPA